MVIKSTNYTIDQKYTSPNLYYSTKKPDIISDHKYVYVLTMKDALDERVMVMIRFIIIIIVVFVEKMKLIINIVIDSLFYYFFNQFAIFLFKFENKLMPLLYYNMWNIKIIKLNLVKNSNKDKNYKNKNHKNKNHKNKHKNIKIHLEKTYKFDNL